ncbi:MAG: M48 family metallopeptidase [Bacteroidales bacterium]|jgi:hypothetical protein|nr:M48 family metallopeptidase [Bacteroidales bacterium]
MTDEIKYQIIFSRRRSLSLIVSPDKGVTVRAPYRTSLKTIERFLQDKSGWIRKHLENHSDLTRINQGKEYIEGETHLFRGTEYELTITRSVKQFVRQYDNKINIGLNRIDDRVKIKTLLVKWYRQQAFEIFRKKVEEICNINKDYIFNPSEIVVKSLKSRWGSCSSKGRITLNAELIKLDERFADYVIIHELCHLKHHNHGKDYYNLLEELVPDYKSIRKELRKFITK